MISKQYERDRVVQYPDDFPEWIIRGIDYVIETFPSYCLSPDFARGNCVRISNELIGYLESINHTGKPLNAELVKSPGMIHWYARIENWNIDLTHRQFDEQADCPLIWKHETLPTICGK